MQKLLASQTMTTSTSNKKAIAADAMDSSIFNNHLINASNTLQTPNQQLLSERFSLSPTPIITMQTISGGKHTNNTTEGFD